MDITDKNITSSPDCEIVSIRVINASKDIAYKAWADPEHLKNWWGPKGFINTFTEFDLRPEGKWSFIMKDPEGAEYPNECTFLKIVDEKLIAWKHETTPNIRVVVSFEKQSSQKTRIVFKMIFNTPEECKGVKAFMGDSNEENFDKLEEEILKMT